MCRHMYVCAHLHVEYTYVREHVMEVHTHVYACVHMYVCVNMDICVHMYVCAHVHV